MVSCVTDSSDLEKKKRSRAVTRQKLIERASEVLVAKGLEGASVAEMCAAAGFSRGAFYSNFESKWELAMAIYAWRVDRLIEILQSEIQRQFEEQTSKEHIVDFALQALSGLDHHGGQWQSLRLEMHLAAERDHTLRAAVREQYERVVEVLAQVLTQVQARGIRYRTNPHHLARILIAVWDGAPSHKGLGASDDMGNQMIAKTWNAFVLTE